MCTRTSRVAQTLLSVLVRLGTPDEIHAVANCQKLRLDFAKGPPYLAGFVGLASQLTKWEPALVRAPRSRRPTGEKVRWIVRFSSLRELSVAPPAVGSRSVRTSGKHQPEERRVAVSSSRWPPALVHRV